jgi:hypothetical protein
MPMPRLFGGVLLIGVPDVEVEVFDDQCLAVVALLHVLEADVGIYRGIFDGT